MFYMHTSQQKIRECLVTIDDIGESTVWIRLEHGSIAMNSSEVDGLINRLSDALTEARELEAGFLSGGKK